MVHNDILLVILGPGQEVNLSARAIKGFACFLLNISSFFFKRKRISYSSLFLFCFNKIKKEWDMIMSSFPQYQQHFTVFCPMFVYWKRLKVRKLKNLLQNVQ